MAEGAIVREDATYLDLNDRGLLTMTGAQMIGEGIQALREEAVETGEVEDEMEALDMFEERENMAYVSMVKGMAVDQDDAEDLMRLFVVLTSYLFEGENDYDEE